ncbi:hypothetical protein [Chelativorans salis]|uniref:Uncharacterized protein n=1 Tax=Chelativorans salis TaxID=2978478 RepID=A0ABT2LNA9_9HYPH|nr:hypothetical protein [Chelativorans sp. EGI FJ00035]MCT7376056.1 hypothetical protein [Chelativorans sp. EGI FJ00035]
MKQLRSISLLTASAALAVALLATGASGQERAGEPVFLAQGADCYAIGQQIAAEQGGTLAKASEESRGGQTVCRIVVLVPGKDGGRPRRAEFTVPAQ